MPGRDGSGVFTRNFNWVTDSNAGINILPDKMDTEFDTYATEITNSVAADGQTTMTGNLKMGGNTVTNIGAPVGVNDALRGRDISDNTYRYLGTTAGTSAAYTLSPSPSIIGYVIGQEFSFTVNAASTTLSGETTLNISAIGAINLKFRDNAGAKQSLIDGLLISGNSYTVRYDGTDFLLLDTFNHIGSASSSESGIVQLASDSEFITGTATDRAVTPANVLNGMLLAEGVQLADQIISAAGGFTLAHGLGRTPKMIQTFLVCQSAEDGYLSGDIVPVPYTVAANGSAGRGCTLKIDSSNVYGKYANTGSPYDLINFTNGNVRGLTNANWRLRIIVWG